MPLGLDVTQVLKPLMGDTRACTCACGTASGATCPGALIDFYAGMACGPTPDQTLVPGSGCAAITIPGGYRSFVSVPGTLQPGSCMAQSTEAGASKPIKPSSEKLESRVRL